MSDTKLEFWEEIILETMNETDPLKLAQLVPQAELAMLRRELALDKCPQVTEEVSTMGIASQALRVVRDRITRAGVLGPAKGNPARFASFARRAGAA